MAKEAEAKKDAKESKEDKKAAKGGDDQLIEKPREPLFSKIGLMILVGSNVLIIVAVVLLVSALSKEDAVKQPEAAGMSTPEASEEQQWLELPNLSSPVVGSGDKAIIVRYSLLIGFEGGPAEQTIAITGWNTGNRDRLLRSWADNMMRSYGESDVRDPGFKEKFAGELRNSLNERLQGAKVKYINIPSLRYD